MRILGAARAAAIEARQYSYFTGLPCKRGHIAARRTHNSSCLGCYPGKQRERQAILDRKSNDLARSKALEAGTMFYFTGCPRKHGHVERRLTSNASCCGCNNKYRQDNVTANAKRNVEWKTKNPEKVRKHRNSQYLRHGEEIRTKIKLWYRANTESQIGYSKKWRRDNSERHTLYQRAYEQKHKERDKLRKYETIARWRRNNPEFVRSRCAHRRALKRGAEGDHSKTDLDVLFDWQKGKCSYCRRPFINKKYSIDHIQALHKWWVRLARKFAIAMQKLQLQEERGRSTRLSPEL
jgi:hypothetical protein